MANHIGEVIELIIYEPDAIRLARSRPEIRDHILPGKSIEDENISTQAARQEVVAFVSQESVLASAAIQRIVARSANQAVDAGIAGDRVRECRAVNEFNP